MNPTASAEEQCDELYEHKKIVMAPLLSAERTQVGLKSRIGVYTVVYDKMGQQASPIPQ